MPTNTWKSSPKRSKVTFSGFCIESAAGNYANCLPFTGHPDQVVLTRQGALDTKPSKVLSFIASEYEGGDERSLYLKESPMASQRVKVSIRLNSKGV